MRRCVAVVSAAIVVALAVASMAGPARADDLSDLSIFGWYPFDLGPATPAQCLKHYGLCNNSCGADLKSCSSGKATGDVSRICWPVYSACVTGCRKHEVVCMKR